MNDIRDQITEAVRLTYEFQSLVEKREIALLESSLRANTMTNFLLEGFDDEEVGDAADVAVKKIQKLINDVVQILEKGGEQFQPVAATIQTWNQQAPQAGFWDKITGQDKKKQAEFAQQATEKMTKIQQGLAVITDTIQTAIDEYKPIMEWANSNKDAIKKMFASSGGNDTDEGDDSGSPVDESAVDSMEFSLKQVLDKVKELEDSDDENIKKAVSSLPKVSDPEKIIPWIKSKMEEPPSWFQKAQASAAKSTGIIGKGIAFLKGLFGGGDDDDFNVDPADLGNAIVTTPIARLVEMLPEVEKSSSTQKQASEDIADASTDVLAAGNPQASSQSSGGQGFVQPTPQYIERGRDFVTKYKDNDDLIDRLIAALEKNGVNIKREDLIDAAEENNDDKTPAEKAEEDVIIAQLGDESLETDDSGDPPNEETIEQALDGVDDKQVDSAAEDQIEQTAEKAFPKASDLLKLGKDLGIEEYSQDIVAHKPVIDLFVEAWKGLNNPWVHRNSLLSLLSEGEESEDSIAWDDISSALKSIPDPELYDVPSEDDIKKFFSQAVEKELLPKKVSGLGSGESESSSDEATIKLAQELGISDDELKKQWEASATRKEILEKYKSDEAFKEWMDRPEGSEPSINELMNWDDFVKSVNDPKFEPLIPEIKENGNFGEWLDTQLKEGTLDSWERVLERSKKAEDDGTDPEIEAPTSPVIDDPEKLNDKETEAVVDAIDDEEGGGNESSDEESPAFFGSKDAKEIKFSDFIEKTKSVGADQQMKVLATALADTGKVKFTELHKYSIQDLLFESELADELSQWIEQNYDETVYDLNKDGEFELKDPEKPFDPQSNPIKKVKTSYKKSKAQKLAKNLAGKSDSWKRGKGKENYEKLISALSPMGFDIKRSDGGDSENEESSTSPGEGTLKASAIVSDLTDMINKTDWAGDRMYRKKEMTPERLMTKLKEMSPEENIEVEGIWDEKATVQGFREEGGEIKVFGRTDSGKDLTFALKGAVEAKFSPKEKKESQNETVYRWSRLAGIL